MQLEDQGATPEVETQQAAPSMEDTIRDTYRNLTSSEEPTAAAPENGPAAGGVEDPEAAAQRIRDAQGKFAKPAEPNPDAAPDAVPADVPVVEAKPAPNTWKKEAAEKWATVDPVVRAEIERREQDFHKGVEQYKERAQFAQTMERAMAPYMQTIQQIGMTPDQAIGGLMALDHKIRHGSPEQKVAVFAQLMHEAGVDISQVANAQQNTDPRVYAAEQEAQQLRAQFQNYQQTAQQQAESALNSEIEAFAADPSHSHFDAVKGHMSALLQAGQAQSLADAYEQAIYANPTTRAAVLQQQEAAKREEAAKKAQAAKAAASINVQRRPAMPTAQPIGSMDDTIRETLRRLQGNA